MNRLLIVKTSAIGDVIQTFPVLDYLRTRFPNAIIDWVVEKNCYELLTAHPDINEVLCINTKKWRRAPFSRENRLEIKAFFSQFAKKQYDLVIDLQGNTKSALFTFMAKATHKVGYGFDSVAEKLNLIATNHRFNISAFLHVQLRYLQLVQKYFQDSEVYSWKNISLALKQKEEKRLSEIMSAFSNFPTFMVCFGSNWSNKRLSEKTLTKFISMLNDQFSPSFLFIHGNEEEKKIALGLKQLFLHKSEAVGELSIALWQNLMAKVDCVITMDSAALHLCATTKTPSFSIFGPSSSSVYKPLGTQHGAFQGSCPYAKVFDKRCPLLRSCVTGACMKELDVNALSKCFSDFWQGLKVPLVL